MNSFERSPLYGVSLLAVVIGLAFNSATVMAIGSSSQLTWGNVSQGGGKVSTSSNPASGAFDRQYLDEDTNVAGYLNLGVSVEYGDVDDLFERINEASAALESAESGGGNGGDGGGSGTDIGTIDDISNPDLDALIDAADGKAAVIAGLLAFIRTEGYAIAQADSELVMLINNDLLGGTLRFDVSGWVNASVIGLTEAVTFDAETALAELNAAYNLGPDDPETTFDLTGGLHLTVDPASGNVSATYDNDSLLLTRAAKLTEFGVSYSRPLVAGDGSTLFLGLRPKLMQAGLTRVTTRLGDLTDAEETFDDVRDADFITQNKMSLDLGLLWQAERYRAGITLTNLGEPEFDFPDIDYSDIDNEEIRDELSKTNSYTAEHQFKLEGAWLSKEQQWGVFAAFDANSVVDAAGTELQWGTLSTAYTFENIWCNNVRLGVKRNFAGNELSYASMGITLFRFLNLDLESSLDNTVIEGEDLPRGLSFALGFNYGF